MNPVHAYRLAGDNDNIPDLVAELVRAIAVDVGVDPYPSPTAPPPLSADSEGAE